MINYRVKLFLTAFIVVGLTACGGESDNTQNSSTGTSIIASGIVADTTVVIDPSSSTTLIHISADQSTITFTGTDATTASIDIGDILALGVTADTPDGMLRKVTGISYNGDQTIFTTTQGTLADAVESAHIAISGTIEPGDVEDSTSGAVGVSISGISPQIAAGVLAVNASNYKFQTTLKDVVLYDDDGDTDTTDDQILANGKLLFNIKYHFEIDVENFEIQHMIFTMTPNEYSDLNISTNIPTPSISKKKTLKTITMRPFTVQVGALPIIVRPKVDINIGIDGRLEVGISTGVSQSASITGGLEFGNNNWSTVSSKSTAFDYEAPQVSANASVLAYAGPTLTLQLYGIVGPNSNAEGYLSFDADIASAPWWTLYGGVRLGAGIEVTVLGHNIASYSVPDVLSYEVLLAQSAPMAPTSVSTTTASNEVTISWGPSTDATKYNIYWNTLPGVQINSAYKIADATSPFTHTGRINDTTYYYTVTAANSYSESSLSNEVSATPTTYECADLSGTHTIPLDVSPRDCNYLGQNGYNLSTYLRDTFTGTHDYVIEQQGCNITSVNGIATNISVPYKQVDANDFPLDQYYEMELPTESYIHPTPVSFTFSDGTILDRLFYIKSAFKIRLNYSPVFEPGVTYFYFIANWDIRQWDLYTEADVNIFALYADVADIGTSQLWCHGNVL